MATQIAVNSTEDSTNTNNKIKKKISLLLFKLWTNA